MQADLLDIYERLFQRFGPQGWWPADEPFEVIVGAILTQNTSWRNVERAIENLKEEGLLNPAGILRSREERLQECLRPSGYFRVKGQRLREFSGFLTEGYGGTLQALFALPKERLRMALLDVKGIGEETADSIILYAAEKPSFVVDAYTKRILSRLGLMEATAAYRDVKRFFEDALPVDLELYQEYHALLVKLAKSHCVKTPRCDGCPLNEICKRYATQSRSTDTITP